MTETIFRDADIPLMLLACGALPCVIGGVAGIGLLDEVEQVFGGDVEHGQVQDQVSTITVQTSAFPDARIDDAMTIDGRTGIVGRRLKIGDGGLTQILFVNTAGTASVPHAAAGGRVVEVSASYVAIAGDSVLVDSSAGNVTITLPLSAANGDRGITVKKISSDAHLVTVAASGSDDVEDDTSVSFDAPNTSIDFLADGISSWVIE
jgi:hypothetical protein